MNLSRLRLAELEEEEIESLGLDLDYGSNKNAKKERKSYGGKAMNAKRKDNVDERGMFTSTARKSRMTTSAKPAATDRKSKRQ